MKRAISLLLILVFMLSFTISASASQIDKKEVKNAALLKKYSKEFMEMEKKLRKIEVKLNNSDIYSLNNGDMEDNILTRTIQEDDGLVTLAIPYSVIVRSNDIIATETHAKLYAKTTWEEDTYYN